MGRTKVRFRLWLSRSRIAVLLLFFALTLPLFAREKDATQYGMGLIVNIPYPENEVVKVVEDVTQNGIIRGSKEYNKDEYISGADAASSSRGFPAWTEGGKVFYKVRLKAIDPRNFKDSGDLGTLTVRYVVQAQDETHTVLRINAVFVEDFRHISHSSNGSVESAEYKDIHDRLDAMDLMKAETAAAERQRQERKPNDSKPSSIDQVPTPGVQPASTSTTSAVPRDESMQSPPQTVEQHLGALREQVERRVKASGAALKSAPFHTATTLQLLASGTEVLIVITSPYWFGVETHEGQHGWILRDELEFVP